MGTAVLSFVAITLTALLKVREISGDVAIGLVAALTSGVVSVVISGFAHLDRVRADAERESLRQREESEREKIRYEEVVLKSLDYFTGQTQRRNVGIAIVEGAWSRTPHLRPVFVPLLVNQAVYLLEESGQAEASHEAENLARIMTLLTGSGVHASLLRSIDLRLTSSYQGPGVRVSSRNLNAWRGALSRTS